MRKYIICFVLVMLSLLWGEQAYAAMGRMTVVRVVGNTLPAPAFSDFTWEASLTNQPSVPPITHLATNAQVTWVAHPTPVGGYAWEYLFAFNLTAFTSDWKSGDMLKIEMQYTDATGTKTGSSWEFAIPSNYTQSMYDSDPNAFIIFEDIPTPSFIVADTFLCLGALNGQVRAEVENAPAEGYKINWGHTDITSSGTPNWGNVNMPSAGTFSLTAILQSKDGLTNYDTCDYTVIVHPTPDFAAKVTPDAGIEPLNVVLNVDNPNTPGVTYQWSVLTGSPNPDDTGDFSVLPHPVDVFGLMAGTHEYRLTGVTAEGCEFYADVEIKVYKALELNPGTDDGKTAYCAGTDIQLEANAEGGVPSLTYQWSCNPSAGVTFVNDTDEDPIVRISTAGTYSITLTITDDAGNSDNKSFSIVIDEKPVFTLAQATPPTVISGNTSQLTAATQNDLGTLEWSGGSFTGSSSGSPVITGGLTSTTTYTVTATNGACQVTKDVTVTVKAPGQELVVTPTGGGDYCETNTTIQLNAGATGGEGALTYAWSVDKSGLTFSSTTIANPTVSGTPGDYVVTIKVKDEDNVEKIGTVNVHIDAEVTLNPVTAIPNPATVGGSSNLSTSFALGSGTITWSGNPAVSPATGTNVTTGTFTSAGNYTYTATATNGACSDSKNVTILVSAPGQELAVNPTGDGDYCETNTAIQLTAGASGGDGNLVYAWSVDKPGLTFSSTTVANPTVSGVPDTYEVTITVTDKNGAGTPVSKKMTIKLDAEVTLNPVTAMPNPATVGGSSSLSTSIASGNGTITWSGAPNVSPATGTNVTTGTFTSAGNYPYTAAVTNGKCSDSKQVVVMVEEDSGEDDAKLTITVGPRVCAYDDAEVKIVLRATGEPGLTYSFILKDKSSNTVMTITDDAATYWEYSVTPGGEGSYYVVGFEAKKAGVPVVSSVSPSSVRVEFYEVPTVIANIGGSTINHCGDDKLTLTGSGSANNYTWSGASKEGGVQNGKPFTPEGGWYVVEGANAYGCKNKDSVFVNLLNKPNVLVEATDTEICIGESVTLTGKGTADVYTWNNGVTDGVPFTPLATNKYTVTGTDNITGCKDTASVVVTVLQKPNIYYKSKNPRNIAIDKDVSFAIKANGGTITYQWQRKVNGTWVNMTDGITALPHVYGAQTDSLTLKGVPESWNDSEFKCIATNKCGDNFEEFQLFVKECFDIYADIIAGRGIQMNTDPNSNVHGYYCINDTISVKALVTAEDGMEIENPTYEWTIDGLPLSEEHFGVLTDVQELVWVADTSFVHDFVIKVCVYSDGACEPVCSRFLRLKAREFDNVGLELKTSRDFYCPGDTIDFWVVADNAGSLPKYTWYNDVHLLPDEKDQMNNTLVHYEQTKITLAMGQEDTWVRVVMKPSNEVCSQDPTLSASVFMKKNREVNPSMKIINDINDTVACTGDLITFEVEITGDAGSNPVIEWRKDIWDMPSGPSITTDLKDQDMWIKATLIPGNDVCYYGDPLVDTMIISVLSHHDVYIWADMEFASEGDVITIESKIENLPTDPEYTWYLNNLIVPREREGYWTSSIFKQGDVVELGVTGKRVCQTQVFSNQLVIDFGSLSRDTVVTTYKNVAIERLNLARSSEEAADYIFSIERNGHAMHGNASITANGMFRYNPDKDYVGSDEVIYTLTNKRDKNKTESGIIYINVLDGGMFNIPNIITPNGDGINDVWQLDFLVDYPNHIVSVYNRHGRIVMQTRNYQNDWDGTGQSNGQGRLPNGIYTYVINLENKQILKGWVELRRDISTKRF